MAELASSDYAALSMDQRLEVLSALMGAALEGPSLRAELDTRLEECARVRRTMAEENRVRDPPHACLALAALLERRDAWLRRTG